MSENCLGSITELYLKSSIPVVVFSDSMEIIWYNKSFSDYFPDQDVMNLNMSAITKTQLRGKLFSSDDYSGRFSIMISSNKKISSSVVLLTFPAEFKDGLPVAFISYIDDITKERNMMLRKTYMGLLEASKLKDDDTGNHIKRVGAYAKRLSEECYHRKAYPQITIDFIENIHFLAPMHDVGKIGTPDEILTKRGSLDESEWIIMKQHTINGALILSNYPDIMATEIARAHHEKWDGSGYLYGLAGDDIPLAARITSIADVYDALRMKRSYKDAFSHSKAIDIMVKDSGTHFDPVLIDIFLSINESFRSIFDAFSDAPESLSGAFIEDLPAYNEFQDEDEDSAELLEEL